jgi:uncharacterized protein (TIGR02646 family)
MIRVHRPAAVPAVLSSRGTVARQRHVDDYQNVPRLFQTGVRTFEFNQDIYGAEAVKTPLRRAQNEKCCFCEAHVGHISYGDVEHIRPKAGFRQRRGGRLTRPGYFWLAYEWTNLLFSCQLCNQRGKETLFPLEQPARRARSPRDLLSNERPLFINPAEEDPSRFLGFREEMLYPVRNSRRGRATIDALHLNRPALAEHRRERLVQLTALAKARLQLLEKIARAEADGQDPSEDRTLVAELDAILRASITPSGEYSAMMRGALQKFGYTPPSP